MLIPGFLAGDGSLAVMQGWLRRMGYDAHLSGILFNVDCSDRALKRLELRAEREAEAHVEPEPTSLERAQEAAMARRAVDALAERDRLALLMREEGLDYQEIAAALGLSVGSIGTTLSRARRRLVEAYEALQRSGRTGEGHAAS
jgi:RNA polymerase sigma-70 factor (ECF subfamily)